MVRLKMAFARKGYDEIIFLIVSDMAIENGFRAEGYDRTESGTTALHPTIC